MRASSSRWCSGVLAVSWVAAMARSLDGALAGAQRCRQVAAYGGASCSDVTVTRVLSGGRARWA